VSSDPNCWILPTCWTINFECRAAEVTEKRIGTRIKANLEVMHVSMSGGTIAQVYESVWTVASVSWRRRLLGR
jgi:hypothetical protein